jgi:hypothetical protein
MCRLSSNLGTLRACNGIPLPYHWKKPKSSKAGIKPFQDCTSWSWQRSVLFPLPTRNCADTCGAVDKGGKGQKIRALRRAEKNLWVGSPYSTFCVAFYNVQRVLRKCTFNPT